MKLCNYVPKVIAKMHAERAAEVLLLSEIEQIVGEKTRYRAELIHAGGSDRD